MRLAGYAVIVGEGTARGEVSDEAAGDTADEVRGEAASEASEGLLRLLRKVGTIVPTLP